MTFVEAPPPSDDVAERIRRTVGRLLDGEDDAAATELEPIAGLTIESHPIDPMPSWPRGRWLPGVGDFTRNPPTAVSARVYVRDHFTCCYCGRKTIPPGIMRLLSLPFPVAFPHHPNWKKSECHRAYWDISTSVDHIQAVARGGNWQDMENLATACSRCQYQKSNLRLDVLGWRVVPPAWGEWDGLVDLYEPPLAAAGATHRQPSCVDRCLRRGYCEPRRVGEARDGRGRQLGNRKFSGPPFRFGDTARTWPASRSMKLQCRDGSATRASWSRSAERPVLTRWPLLVEWHAVDTGASATATVCSGSHRDQFIPQRLHGLYRCWLGDHRGYLRLFRHPRCQRPSLGDLPHLPGRRTADA